MQTSFVDAFNKKQKKMSFIQLFYMPKKHKKQLLLIKSIKQQAL